MIPSVFFLVSIIVCLAGHVSAGGDDFAYDLSSNLGPILALFVERVVMQFMSQGMDIMDCILLAMAPIGAVTIVPHESAREAYTAFKNKKKRSICFEALQN
ncbi:uncharacterized protein TrAtP1_002963 [Trichoderma atroviride]|uniref:uncharacterized protein n=1 Tax=Hypocrea atroviridis TaxID=63577 RepID=UPI00333406B7|nr:hypothetical protein TrAtP1_002963 [Trichoderma atroviride]